MEIKEYSQVGMDAVSERQTIIIGMSVNNSYFNESNIEKLLLWAREKTDSVFVMIPDKPAVDTFLSLGYSNEESERKARLKSNNLENKCRVIIKRHDIQGITIIRWNDVVGSLRYVESIRDIKYSYDDDMEFKEKLRLTTKGVLSYAGKTEITDNVIDYGVLFLLQELAFIARSTLILKKEKVAYVYHQTMEVLKNIFENKYQFAADPNVGFVTVG